MGVSAPSRPSTEVESAVAGSGIDIVVADRVGWIRLDRPEALNALTLEMVTSMRAALAHWETDPQIDSYLVTGEGRAFCAGGDVRWIVEEIAERPDNVRAFWRAEYDLDLAIHQLHKPYVAVMDGIVMGGGVGISAHGRHRIVTERTRLAMPELRIGFCPDVGGTRLLANAPGEVGLHVALTSASLEAADIIYCGLADRAINSRDLHSLLESPPGVLRLAQQHQEPPCPSLAAQRPWIDECYSAPTVELILERLRSHPQQLARNAATIIESQPPTALKVALRALRTARQASDLAEVLAMEFGIVSRSLIHHDFTEGIRARMVEKRSPVWQPATLSEVTDAAVAEFFDS